MSASSVKRLSVNGVLLASAVSLAACGAVRAAVYVPVAPPAPIRETLVVSPGVGYVWIPGHHQWEGGAYLWVGGRWEPRPHDHARWENGRWRHNRNGWYWVEGRWR